MEQAKYLFGNLLNLPLFPILYFQGKQVLKSVPKLPEAKGPQGSSGHGTRVIKLLSIGESTIAGVGVETHAQGFTGHLSNELSSQLNAMIQWQVIAKSGYTARKVSEYLLPKIGQQEADIIIIGLGGNDTFELNSPKRWKQDIEEMIAKLKLKLPDTPIVFSNVPPIRSFPAFTKTIKYVLGRQIDLLHSVLKKIADQTESVWYVEERIALNRWIKHFAEQQYTAKDFFSDGVHPSELTYKTWGIEVAKFILREGILSRHHCSE